MGIKGAKKLSLGEVTWPFVTLAVGLDALFVVAYVLSAMSEQMFYQLVTAKFSFLVGSVATAWYATKKSGE